MFNFFYILIFFSFAHKTLDYCQQKSNHCPILLSAKFARQQTRQLEKCACISKKVCIYCYFLASTGKCKRCVTRVFGLVLLFAGKDVGCTSLQIKLDHLTHFDKMDYSMDQSDVMQAWTMSLLKSVCSETTCLRFLTTCFRF